MLARIPFWGWFLIILATLYTIYNPLGYSLWHMWTLFDPSTLMPYNIMATLMVLVILGLVLHGTTRAMSWWGLLVMITLVAVGLWCLHSLIAFNIMSMLFWSWAAQPLLALIFTVGWQWPKIWRRATGTVSVDDSLS